MAKSKFNLKSVIHNQYVLYTVCLIALMNVIQYANAKDFNSMFSLLIIGFVTSFFSKNMVVILSISIITTYCLRQINISQFQEGLEGIEDEDETVEGDDDTGEVDDENIEDEHVKSEDDSELDSSVMKDNLEEFAQLQHGIIEGLEKIEPMLSRAESFIEKFNKHSTELSNLKTKK